MTMRVASTFTEIDKKTHERKRRIVSHGFSDAALRSYEPRIMDNVNKLVDRMLSNRTGPDGWTESINMGDYGKFRVSLSTLSSSLLTITTLQPGTLPSTS
jgi:hypothetical protein